MRLHRLGVVAAAGLIVAACAATSPGETGRPAAPERSRAGSHRHAVPDTHADATSGTAQGGRTIFPEHRLVGFSGGRGESLGRLGIGDIDERAAEIESIAAQYTPEGRRPLPVFELIAVIAHGTPADGACSHP